MAGTGSKKWAIPGGNVPVKSNGHEPELTSFDQLSILNTNSSNAQISLTIYFSETETYGPYKIEMPGKRVKKIRINDLIDPLAVPLGEPYACLIEADVEVVLQFTRQDTSQQENAGCTTLAFPVS